MTSLKKGDQAPNFIAKDENGNDVSLSSYQGKKVALYFYPRDLTPTCTDQACNLRDGSEALAEHGIAVLGVNDDPATKHQKFIEKHKLNFPLIADTDQTVLRLYGVWGPKKFMGKEFEGTHRTTFLIDEQGTIVDVITKVKAKNHTQQVLEGFGLS
jgi:peroxiredoxin Q/BCP